MIQAAVGELAGRVAQLEHGLVDEAEAVSATPGQLTSVGVQRQLTVEGDAAAVTDEVLRLAEAAEAEVLEPAHAVDCEAVVQQGHVDVVRAGIGAGSASGIAALEGCCGARRRRRAARPGPSVVRLARPGIPECVGGPAELRPAR